MKLLLLVLCCLGAGLAQTAKPTSYAEITGDAATHTFAASGVCKAIQIILPAGNSAVVRVGDSTTSVSKGLPLAAGSGLWLAPLTSGKGGQEQQYYSLADLYYYAATGDKVDFVCFK